MDVEEAVVGVATAADQFIDKGQGDVVVDRGEVANKCSHCGILHKRGVGEEDVDRCGIIVDNGVGNGLDGFLVAHVVSGARDKAVDITVDQRIVCCVCGCVVAHGGIYCIVERHHQLHIVHTTALRVVSGSEGKVAHQRVGGKGLGREVRGGWHRVEGVLPRVGVDGGVVIEDDGGIHRHRVA